MTGEECVLMRCNDHKKKGYVSAIPHFKMRMFQRYEKKIILEEKFAGRSNLYQETGEMLQTCRFIYNYLSIVRRLN